MKVYFSNLFEVIRYERALILLLSKVERDILKQSKFTDSEVSIKKRFWSWKNISSTES